MTYAVNRSSCQNSLAKLTVGQNIEDYSWVENHRVAEGTDCERRWVEKSCTGASLGYLTVLTQVDCNCHSVSSVVAVVVQVMVVAVAQIQVPMLCLRIEQGRNIGCNSPHSEEDPGLRKTVYHRERSMKE
jgi:hypothetical protein